MKIKNSATALSTVCREQPDPGLCGEGRKQWKIKIKGDKVMLKALGVDEVYVRLYGMCYVVKGVLLMSEEA